jgi:predicted nucleic acid-binding protein
MSRAVLDTSFVIDVLAGQEVAVPDESAISVITIGELRAGVLRMRDARARVAREERLRIVRERFTPLLVDEDVAEHYGRALALARDEGRNDKATDLLIIATAAAADNALHTRDERQAKLARRLGLIVHGLRSS